jgi:hypothetical protein
VDPGQLADKAVSILTALALNASSGLYNGLVQAGGTRLYQVIEQRIQAGDSSAWGLLLRLRGEPQNQQVANWLATSLATLAATDEGFARELEEAIQRIETSSPPARSPEFTRVEICALGVEPLSLQAQRPFKIQTYAEREYLLGLAA